MKQSSEAHAALKTLLVVAPEPPPYYGAAVATGRLLAAGRRGHFRFRHVDIMDPAGTSNMGKLMPANFILAGKHYLKTLWYLLSQRDIEAVYLLLAFTNAPAFWRDLGFLVIAHLFRKPFIIHCHDSLVEEFYRTRSWPTRQAVGWALGAARSVVVLCPRMASATRRVAPTARVDIVPNGLDLAPGARAAQSAPRSQPVPLVLFLSQLSEEKGFLTALQIAARLRKQETAVRFEFAGGWKSAVDEARARRWVAEHGLDAVVHLRGPVTEEQKTQLLESADAFLFPTQLRHEGQPLVILEAMAAGLPVITTDIGCIRDTVQDGATGFVLPPGDVDAMVDKLGVLIRDAEVRQAMGKAAQARYLLHYTNEQFIQRMMALFRETVPLVLPEFRSEQRILTQYELT